MTLSRRKFFAALAGLPLVGKVLAAKPTPIPDTASLDAAYRQAAYGKESPDLIFWSGDHPVILPCDAKSFFIDRWRLAPIQEAINDCTFGREAPRYMVVTQQLRDLLWMALPEQSRYFPSVSDLREAGYQTFMFMGCEVVVDRSLHHGEMVLVNPDRIDSVKHNAVIRFSNLIPEYTWNSLSPQSRQDKVDELTDLEELDSIAKEYYDVMEREGLPTKSGLDFEGYLKRSSDPCRGNYGA